MVRQSVHLSVSKLVYRGFLHLYPSAFRRRFADQMVEDFVSIYDTRCAAHGFWGPLAAWGDIFADGFRSIPSEHADIRLSRCRWSFRRLGCAAIRGSCRE